MSVTYELNRGVARITMDDGKANALSPPMQSDITDALDRAAKDDAVTILTGREGMFSAGFDLKVLGSGGLEAIGMVKGGFLLAERMLTHPKPLVIACTGHAIAMGAFLLLCADYRVGPIGDYKIQANEVAIGLTMPQAAIEIARYRLNPAHFERVMINAEILSPEEEAAAAGFFDIATNGIEEQSWWDAQRLAELDQNAHTQTKLKARAPLLKALRAAIEAEFGA